MVSEPGTYHPVPFLGTAQTIDPGSPWNVVALGKDGRESLSGFSVPVGRNWYAGGRGRCLEVRCGFSRWDVALLAI